MDIFNLPKTVEQGIYDAMMWIFFYPYTLARVIIRPGKTLQYVQEQSNADSDSAYAAAMRPALLLFLSIAIGSLLAPIPPEVIAYFDQFNLAKAVGSSWFSLLIWRMMVYSFFALAGALFYDLLTPGAVTRETLRVPFHQQCYVCAPFSLLIVPLLVKNGVDPKPYHIWLFGAATIWFLCAQFIFFRQYLKRGIVACVGLAAAVLGIGVAWIFITQYALIVL